MSTGWYSGFNTIYTLPESFDSRRPITRVSTVSQDPWPAPSAVYQVLWDAPSSTLDKTGRHVRHSPTNAFISLCIASCGIHGVPDENIAVVRMALVRESAVTKHDSTPSAIMAARAALAAVDINDSADVHASPSTSLMEYCMGLRVARFPGKLWCGEEKSSACPDTNKAHFSTTEGVIDGDGVAK